MKKREFKKSDIVKIAIIGVLCVVAVIGVASTSGVEIGQDGVKIRGMYGTAISFSSLRDVELYEKDLPLGLVRVNGIGLGFIEIGRYRMPDLGSVKLIILKREAPYLVMKTEGDTILIGLGAKENVRLRDDIASELQKRGISAGN